MKKIIIVSFVGTLVLITLIFIFQRTEFDNILSRIITGNNIARFINPKNSFSRLEIPSFDITIPQKTVEDIGKTQLNKWVEANEHLVVQLQRVSDNSPISAKIYKQ